MQETRVIEILTRINGRGTLEPSGEYSPYSSLVLQECLFSRHLNELGCNLNASQYFISHNTSLNECNFFSIWALGSKG